MPNNNMYLKPHYEYEYYEGYRKHKTESYHEMHLRPALRLESGLKLGMTGLTIGEGVICENLFYILC